MADWVDAALSKDVPLNGTFAVRVSGWKILLVRSESGLFALEDKCPHQEQGMSGGLVHAGDVECPWHSVRIDLSNGKILNDMGFVGLPDVKVFLVQEKDGRIQVKI